MKSFNEKSFTLDGYSVDGRVRFYRCNTPKRVNYYVIPS